MKTEIEQIEGKMIVDVDKKKVLDHYKTDFKKTAGELDYNISLISRDMRLMEIEKALEKAYEQGRLDEANEWSEYLQKRDTKKLDKALSDMVKVRRLIQNGIRNKHKRN